MLGSAQLKQFAGFGMTDEATKPLAEVPISDRGAALLNAGMTAAASPLAIQTHGQVINFFRAFSKAVWAVPVIGLIWASLEGQPLIGLGVALFLTPFAWWFSFVARKVAAGNQVLQDELRKAGI